MPTSWVLSIVGIFFAVIYGLIVWQRQRLRDAHTFLGEVKAELKKVTWPNRKEVMSTTSVVVVTAFFFGSYLSVVDFVVGMARHWLYAALGVSAH